MSVESSAVLAVKNLLDFNPYINTDYLNVGDKYPSYDGEILIYNNSKGKKDGLNQVKVQIKGEFIMKKILSLIIVLTLAAVSLFGCNSAPKHFTGEWKFSAVEKVEFIPALDEGTLDMLKQVYNAEDEESILNNALDSFIADKTFENFYLKFDGKYTYTYDSIMDREATWVFYQTSETEGFISFDAELDVNNGNPDPVVYPEISYKADTDAMFITLNNYGSFMVTLKLTR